MTRKQLRLFVGGMALLLLSIGAMAARAASPSAPAAPVQIRKVDTSAYPTIGITVAVGTEISPKDILVTENGSLAQIITVRPLLETGRGVDVVLAIDTSNSVAGEPLQQAVAAARAFVQSLPSTVGVGVVTFSDQARVLALITKDHAGVLSALSSLVDTQQGTALYDGVATAAEMFSGPAQHNIVLLTDGADVGSRISLDQAVKATAKVPAAIFAVGLNGFHADFGALGALAEGTSGVFQPVDTANLASLYQSLARQLGRQYLVLYRSTGPAGAQVTVGVRTPVGEDRSVVLLPRRSGPPRSSGDDRPLLFGAWGLAITLCVAFLAAFLLAIMIIGGRYRARRDRTLALRMSAPAWAQEDRLRQVESPAAWVPGSLVQFGSAVAEAGGFKPVLDRKLERAGLPVTPGEVVGASIVTAFVGLAAGGLLFRSVVFALIIGVVGALLPLVFVQVKLGRRLDQLQAQLPDVLMILASSMRAGHSFQQALDAVAKEVGDPGGAEFGRVVTEIRLGRPFDEALNA
ncbi:MAG TPA: VWA domain-containing protein, partial [Actinomycetota bacterium]|nr:VWA domain-containing protein [Actinomycetota bacterium]